MTVNRVSFDYQSIRYQSRCGLSADQGLMKDTDQHLTVVAFGTQADLLFAFLFLVRCKNQPNQSQGQCLYQVVCSRRSPKTRN